MTNNSVITVIDDDESVRESLQGFLKSLGFTVHAFSSAEDFLNSDSLRKTDCIVLDVRMPKMSGPDLQMKLKESREQIPIIFITAHEEDNVRSHALQTGAVDFLLKPFSDEALINAIRMALQTT
jgi:FixJ family two-component response regulator